MTQPNRVMTLAVVASPSRGRGRGEAIADYFDRVVVVLPNGCWLFPRICPTTGYGRLSGPKNGGKQTVLMHRWAYEHFIGPIPNGLQLDHKCRNRPCVNPTHLDPVTARQNLLRSDETGAGRNAAKTHCYKGHPFAGKNLMTDRRGNRQCRTCYLAHQRRNNARRPERRNNPNRPRRSTLV